LLIWYNIITGKGNRAESTRQEAERMDEQAMTNAEFDSFLETLAKLVEATAISPEDAARIIREAKTK